MIQAPDMLQKLRRTVLTHAIDGLPDLASLAADLQHWVEAYRSGPDTGLDVLLSRARGHEQWLLGEHSQPQVSMMLMTWPANASGPAYEVGRYWSIELVLRGALNCETRRRDDAAAPAQHDWMAAGDIQIFQPDRNRAMSRRSRNLSKSDTAVSLHVFGASPAAYLAVAAEELGGVTDSGAGLAADRHEQSQHIANSQIIYRGQR